MARLFDDVQDEYLQIEQAVLAGAPLAFVCLFNTDVLATIQMLMWSGDKDTVNNSLYLFLHNTDLVSFASRTTISSEATATLEHTANNWHHACGIEASATDRRVLLDGANKGTNATNSTPVGLERTSIGMRRSGTPDFPTSGMIAEAAVYDLSAYPGATNALKADYFEANILPHLAAAEPPGDYTTGLIAYWPLRDDDEDHAGEFDMTPYNTPSWSAHPPMLYLLSGLIEAQSGVTGNLQWLKELAGLIEAQSGLTGAIDSVLVYSLAGLIEAQSGFTGSILSTELLSSLIETQSEVIGNLKESAVLAGLIGSQSALTGNLKELQKLAGLIEGNSTLVGSLQWLQVVDVTVFPATLQLATTLWTPEVITRFVLLPPFMERDLIDPYSGGAWLWLAQITIPGYSARRIARNTEDIVYGGILFKKGNFDPGKQSLAGDASVPRVQLRVAQECDRTLEDIVNATKGGENGTVTLIRTCEKYLESPVGNLEATYDILTAGSDPEWITFLLGMPNPLLQRIPLWSYSSKVCPLATLSLFKGPRCQYVGLDTVCTGLFEACYAKGNAEHWGAEIGLDPNAVRV